MEIYSKRITSTECRRGDLMLPMTKKFSTIWNDFSASAGLAVVLGTGIMKTWNVELRSLQGAEPSCTVQVVHHSRKMLKLSKTFMQANNVTVGSKVTIACVLDNTSPASGWLELSVVAPARVGPATAATPIPVPVAPTPAAAVPVAPVAALTAAAIAPSTLPAAGINAAPTFRRANRARKSIVSSANIAAAPERTVDVAAPAIEAEPVRPQRKRAAPKSFDDYSTNFVETEPTVSSGLNKKARLEKATAPVKQVPVPARTPPFSARAPAAELAHRRRKSKKITSMLDMPTLDAAPAKKHDRGRHNAANKASSKPTLAARPVPLPAMRKRAREELAAASNDAEDVENVEPVTQRRRTSPDANVAEQAAGTNLWPETSDMDEDMAVADILVMMTGGKSASTTPMLEDEEVAGVATMLAQSMKRERAGGLRRQPRPSRRFRY